MKRGLVMTKADAMAHQAKHGFLKGGDASCPNILKDSGARNGAATSNPKAAPKPRQNATEGEYGLILEAMKRRGEILDYRPFGMKFEWGGDPVTGKPMVYSPDFVVWKFYQRDEAPPDTLIEVKGPHIYPQDWIRFKGCRAEWRMFRFELHQKTSEGWRRLL